MKLKYNPIEVVDSITDILEALKNAPEVKIHRLSQEQIATQRDHLLAIVTELLPKAEHAVAQLQNERDDLSRSLSNVRTLGLSAVRSAFGQDSDEYDRAGGTRTSERKARRRSVVKSEDTLKPLGTTNTEASK